MSENHIVRYLSALTEQGSFSKASQVLDISQPSLSQFVQRLEAESGVTLVDRASRPLTLTFAGECYLRTEKEIERLRDLRDKEIADIEPTHGPNRLGDIPHSLASIDKAKRLLDYAPQYSMRDGLKEACKWYWENLK
jgi:DNA-binding transcriptional LysR family regulator